MEPQPHVAGLFGPSSITWRLARERALLLGGPRALLLQLAHPMVAAGVDEHSSFPADPLTRLRRTLDATLGIVFGTADEAERWARRINGVHGAVRGALPDSVGPFAAGTPYQALDPALLMWVHATLVDTTLRVYPMFVGELHDLEMQAAYEESKTVARLLGVPGEVLPASLRDFQAYMDEQFESDVLTVGPRQRALGLEVLYPKVSSLVPRGLFRPAAPLTIGLLPDRVRAEFGLQQTAAGRRVLDATGRGLRRVVPLLPARARFMPQYRAALRRVLRASRTAAA